jgi:hypothetical protein
MTLWTPDGEVPIPRGGDGEPDAADPGADTGATLTGPDGAPIDLDSLSPEERAQAEAFIAEMAEAQQRIAATPVDALVANHAVGLYDLAAIKLQANPPQFEEARLAIDAFGAIVEGVGDRLGEHAGQLQEALTTIRMAWVQLRDRAAEAGADVPGD